MRTKIVGFLGAVFLAISQFGCSNEVEVIGVWQDIPVVYGILDATKDTNYIRIERAYLPPNESAYVVAKNPDSIYFDPNDVEVTMQRIGGNNDTINWPIPLVRVNLANEGIQRDSGIFAHNPAYAYRLVGITFGHYHLVIRNLKTGNVFRATAEGLSTDNSFISLSPNYAITKPITWVKEVGGELQFQPYLIDIKSDLFGAIYDIGVRFFYKEYQIDGTGAMIANTVEDKMFDWKARRNFIPQGQFDATVTGEDFFNALKSNLSDVTATNTRRCGGYLEIYIDGASQSLADYITSTNANDGALGGLYPTDPSSNVTGGYGVLASSNRLERSANIQMKMSDLTYEYLATGDLTQKLGFENATSPCY